MPTKKHSLDHRKLKIKFVYVSFNDTFSTFNGYIGFENTRSYPSSLSFRVRIRVRYRIGVGFMIRVRVRDRVGLEWYLGLGYNSLYQLSGRIWVEIWIYEGSCVNREGRKEMFYLTTHSTHFIYGYMASDIW